MVNMGLNKHFFISFVILIFTIFLIGCQQQIQEETKIQESETIEIVDEKMIDEELEKEFDDDLDEALQELEEIENI